MYRTILLRVIKKRTPKVLPKTAKRPGSEVSAMSMHRKGLKTWMRVLATGDAQTLTQVLLQPTRVDRESLVLDETAVTSSANHRRELVLIQEFRPHARYGSSSPPLCERPTDLEKE